jgi:hypothetical protein
MTDRERNRLAAACQSINHDIDAIVYHFRRVQHQITATAVTIAQGRVGHQPATTTAEADPTPEGLDGPSIDLDTV